MMAENNSIVAPIKNNLSHCNAMYASQDYALACSVGCADLADGCSLENVIREADEQMFDQKSARRNSWPHCGADIRYPDAIITSGADGAVQVDNLVPSAYCEAGVRWMQEIGIRRAAPPPAWFLHLGEQGQPPPGSPAHDSARFMDRRSR